MKLRIDLSDFICESEKLIGQLAIFLEEKAKVKAEISGKEILAKSKKRFLCGKCESSSKDSYKKKNKTLKTSQNFSVTMLILFAYSWKTWHRTSLGFVLF